MLVYNLIWSDKQSLTLFNDTLILYLNIVVKLA